jgi:hypothetical protein
MSTRFGRTLITLLLVIGIGQVLLWRLVLRPAAQSLPGHIEEASGLARRDPLDARPSVASAVRQVSSPAFESDPGEPKGSPPSGPTLEEAARLHEDQHARKIQNHWAEPIDSSWADTAQANMTSDLLRVSKGARFDLVSVECRSTSCLGTFRWASFGDAAATYGAILQASLSMNCAREILLPQPKDVAAPYNGIAVFDCVRNATSTN